MQQGAHQQSRHHQKQRAEHNREQGDRPIPGDALIEQDQHPRAQKRIDQPGDGFSRRDLRRGDRRDEQEFHGVFFLLLDQKQGHHETAGHGQRHHQEHHQQVKVHPEAFLADAAFGDFILRDGGCGPDQPHRRALLAHRPDLLIDNIPEDREFAPSLADIKKNGQLRLVPQIHFRVEIPGDDNSSHGIPGDFFIQGIQRFHLHQGYRHDIPQLGCQPGIARVIDRHPELAGICHPAENQLE